eukprot:671276-Rhodomonas_salina.1
MHAGIKTHRQGRRDDRQAPGCQGEQHGVAMGRRGAWRGVIESSSSLRGLSPKAARCRHAAVCVWMAV